jgi:TRAP-type transport system periplasmic protein
MIPFKHHPAVLATTLLLAVAHAPANAQKTIRLTAAAGHPPVFLWVKHLDDVFIPEVDRRLALTGNYKIDWTKAWGGTLVKLGSESKGMGDGVVDLGVVATVFETPRFPLQSISFYAPFGSDRVDLVSNTISDLQKSVPAMRYAWTKNGLKYLAGVSGLVSHLEHVSHHQIRGPQWQEDQCSRPCRQLGQRHGRGWCGRHAQHLL